MSMNLSRKTYYPIVPFRSGGYLHQINFRDSRTGTLKQLVGYMKCVIPNRHRGRVKKVDAYQ